MYEEKLFEMVNEAVEYAKNELETKQTLQPFAMILFENGNVESLKSEDTSQEKQYEELITQLKKRVADDNTITALALTARVNIPEQYKAAVNDGIRIHLEERNKSDSKIGARFLYVPYQLYRSSEDGEITMQLHDPIPIAFPAEIFI